MNEINAKIRRLNQGERPRVMDLFAGCGGLSLGFHRAGFDIAAAVELDPIAAESHSENFYASHSALLKSRHAQSRDITSVEPAQLLKELGFRGLPQNSIDVIVGGPPCQAFARVGRAKLREIAAHPTAFKQDPRSNLYLRYLHYVRKLKPVALLMENVPDVLNFGGHNIAEEISEALQDLGYRCKYTLLNAVYFGVPEMRERMFLIAYHRDLDVEVAFPKPTHWIELPRGYDNSRQVALKAVRQDLFDDENHFEAPPAVNRIGTLPAVSAYEALSDLPPITKHLDGGLARGRKDPREEIEYRPSVPPSKYALSMRNWPGFTANGTISGHVMRSLPRDYQIFRRMNPGDQYPEAHRHALELFSERLMELSESGKSLVPGSKAYEELKKAIVPPYDAGKFPNKWRKMETDLPARTLMAHLGKDSYSHIHFDSDQARTISVREAARLQSFPDGFVFSGSMNPAFRQIGNAVPPLLAYSLAVEMSRALGMKRQ